MTRKDFLIIIAVFVLGYASGYAMHAYQHKPVQPVIIVQPKTKIYEKAPDSTIDSAYNALLRTDRPR